ncbi:hypothetical protein NPIL_191071 [Nephila pilipes]|uniref:Uncharacterized protein n=1 Tax=Nephila pilipes TaxID=299642 RepID=A0A8X6JU67_NEPPI|nr:hypothetical protein NPIL_191071 [Nephila pilipes]
MEHVFVEINPLERVLISFDVIKAHGRETFEQKVVRERNNSLGKDESGSEEQVTSCESRIKNHSIAWSGESRWETCSVVKPQVPCWSPD